MHAAFVPGADQLFLSCSLFSNRLFSTRKIKVRKFYRRVILKNRILSSRLIPAVLIGSIVDIRARFNTPDRKNAEALLQAAIQKYALTAPRLSAWMEENLAEEFTVFDFPLEHRRTIRISNSMERINKEIRRRTRVVGVFPNEASCLRLISALLMDTSEEWQIGNRYCACKSLNC